jgi:hypothetical protein
MPVSLSVAEPKYFIGKPKSKNVPSAIGEDFIKADSSSLDAIDPFLLVTLGRAWPEVGKTDFENCLSGEACFRIS